MESDSLLNLRCIRNPIDFSFPFIMLNELKQFFSSGVDLLYERSVLDSVSMKSESSK